jgi:predicted transcriptional regulator
MKREFKEFEAEMDHFERLFSSLSNSGRLQIMRSLFEAQHSLTFTELMNMHNMNPKLVSDYTKMLRSIGLIDKDTNGKYYPTGRGEASFLTISLGLRRILNKLKEPNQKKER